MTFTCALISLSAAASGLKANSSSEQKAITPRCFSIKDKVTVNNRVIYYRMTARDTVIANADTNTRAVIFSFFYSRIDAKQRDACINRPVLFVFNGGPGSSSAWLHIGLLGPKRLSMKNPLRPSQTPPFSLGNNPYTLLDIADIVFIDTPGTGYSYVLPSTKASEYYDMEADARLTADFIETWLTENNRWNSPKYLVGESYGTIRAAMTARFLNGGVFSPDGSLTGISLNGIIMLGQALYYFDKSHPVSANEKLAIYLPSMAATSRFYEKSGSSQEFTEFVQKAADFSRKTYLPALYAGNSLKTAEKQHLYQSLAEITGLPYELVKKNRGRISVEKFCSSLLKDKVIAQYDSRFNLPSAGLPPVPDPVGDDPEIAQYSPAFAAGMNIYLKQLGITSKEKYNLINFKVNKIWKSTVKPPGIYPVNALTAVMRSNRDLKLFIASGYYDFATPFEEASYLINQNELPADRITKACYKSGHMIFIDDQSARKLSADLRNFIKSSTK